MPPTFPHAGNSLHHVSAGGNTSNNASSSSASRSGGSGGSTSPNNIAVRHSNYHYPGNLHHHHHPNTQAHSQQQQQPPQPPPQPPHPPQQQQQQQHHHLHQQQQYGSRPGVSWSSLTSSTGHVGIPMDDDLQPIQGSLPSFNQQQQYQMHAMHYQPQQHLQQRRLPASRDAEWGSFPPLSASGPSTTTPPYQSYAGMNDKRASHVMVPATSFQPLPTLDHAMSSPTVSSSQTFLIPPPPSLQANNMYYHDQQPQHPPPPQLDTQSPRNVQQHQRHSYAKPYPDHTASSLYRVEERPSAPANRAQFGQQ
ncbi:hypothetical protein DFQ27_006694 [Actinomortierella ambigua]|uniref:Uncharacterized protein n=1 Tax=Actinomortierella ambigua TaxID=1343610 RepID=A0A9P6QGV1_9FUNG|nr:hypothetical protein DFQ27_006694 [Actinomortierella ambigua]